eukprot:3720184-Lingulodinium_polyedra.AAC.1
MPQEQKRELQCEWSVDKRKASLSLKHAVSRSQEQTQSKVCRWLTLAQIARLECLEKDDPKLAQGIALCRVKPHHNPAFAEDASMRLYYWQ